MKKLLLILLVTTGCATASEKATLYCDNNWQGRYNSWQSCYDRQIVVRNRSSILQSAGQGLQNVRHNSVNCSTFGNQTTCN